MQWIYILIKFFYFFFAVKVMRFLVLVWEKIVFSFNYNFTRRIVYTIYFRDLDIVSYIRIARLGVFDYQFFLSF